MTATAVRIEDAKRLASSRNGNPRFLLTLSNGSLVKTETDGSVGYDVDNWLGRMRREPDLLLDVHLNGRGVVWSIEAHA